MTLCAPLQSFFTNNKSFIPSLRTALAALAAYGASLALHLPEPHWAALSAVIVSRPQRGAAVQAGADRVVGTLIGAGLGCLASAGRYLPVHPLLPLAAVLLLLAFLTAWREGYRTAPIAALIVFSAAPAGHGALAAALLRITEIGLGAGIGVAASWFVLPRHSLVESLALARKVQRTETRALYLAAQGDRQGSAALRTEAGQGLYALALLARAARWEKTDTAALEAIRQAARRLDLSAGFAVRTLLAMHAEGNPILYEQSWQQELASHLAQLYPENERSQTAQDKPSPTRQENTPEACPSPKHKVQAAALRYALGMALRDSKTLEASLAVSATGSASGQDLHPF